MSVEQFMTQAPIACVPGDSLNEAARIMWENDCGFVPVIDSSVDRRVVGVITDRDVCMCAYTRGAPLDSLQVEEAMARTVRTCKADDPVQSAEETMQEAQVRRLPVVDDAGRLIGVLSLSDLARRSNATRSRQSRKDQPSKAEIGELVSSISARRELAAAAAG